MNSLQRAPVRGTRFLGGAEWLGVGRADRAAAQVEVPTVMYDETCLRESVNIVNAVAEADIDDEQDHQHYRHEGECGEGAVTTARS